LITAEAQTVKLIYHKLNDESTEGLVLVQYQDEQGKSIAENELLRGSQGTSYVTVQKNVSGYAFKETIGNVTGTFQKDTQVVTYVYSNSDVPDEVLVPVWRAYNLNDGDHLYTT
ncbi:MucBP domain-containing protein, partial [Enterococcus sp. ALS3]